MAAAASVDENPRAAGADGGRQANGPAPRPTGGPAFVAGSGIGAGRSGRARSAGDGRRGFVDPTFTSPVADLLLRLPRRGGSHDADASKIARRAAAAVDKRIATGRLARRNITPVDGSIVEEEIIDVSGLWGVGGSLEAGDRLAPDQIEALAGGDRTGEIHSVDQGSPSMEKINAELLR